MTHLRLNPVMTTTFCVLVGALISACGGGNGADSAPSNLMAADSNDVNVASVESSNANVEKFETSSHLDVQGQASERENAQALDAASLELRARRYLAALETTGSSDTWNSLPPSSPAASSAGAVVVASAASAPSLPPNVTPVPGGATPVTRPVMRDVLSTLRVTDCASSGEKDFIEKIPQILSRLTPGDCRVVQDNPVNFAWPEPKDRASTQPWSLRVLDKNGKAVVTQSTFSPRLILNAPLATGRYSWTVSYVSTGGQTRTSAVRQFEIKSSVDSAMPSAEQLIAQLKKRSSPRVLPSGMSFERAKLLAQRGDYARPFSQLDRDARRAAVVPLPTSPESRSRESFANDAARARWLKGLMDQTNDELRLLELLAFDWQFSKDPVLLTAAKARLMNLVAWNPEGGSSETQQPQANRNIYLALAMGYDLLGSQLSGAERSRLITAFNTRMAATMKTLQTLDGEPYASFANTDLHFVTRALLLVAGAPGFDMTQAWLSKAWPLFLAQFQAFAGEDGGYDGSVAYAWYDMHVASRSLATVALVTGIDLSRRAYVQNMGDFLIAMTAPNTEMLNAFGDGTEQKRLYANYSADAYRMYAAVTRQPSHEWYWRVDPENAGVLGYISPLHYMLLARQLHAVSPAAPTRNDFVYDDVGMVALHNHVAASDRSSVMFRSSRFGSYGHAHADQNSFTFNSHGVNLLINSGYYPYYNSPHHAQINRATRYKNAVTFDGGIGQAETTVNPTKPSAPMSTMETRGKLVGAMLGDDVSVVTGDATKAYSGFNVVDYDWKPLIDGALRSVAYFKKEGVVVVYDWLSSPTARRWEWNYHGVEPFAVDGKTLIAKNGKVKACIQHYGVEGRPSTTNRFEIAPENGAPEQGHARFTANEPSKQAVMVSIIKEDCSDVAVTVDIKADRAEVKVKNHIISLNKDEAVVTQ